MNTTLLYNLYSTICKITWKSNELPIPDIRARTSSLFIFTKDEMKNRRSCKCIGLNGSVIAFSREQPYWLRSGPLDWSFMLAYFMSRIRIDALHVNDVAIRIGDGRR